MEPKFEPKQHTPEEIAALEKSRTISDAELLKGGAEYVVGEEGEKEGLLVADKQFREIHEEFSSNEMKEAKKVVNELFINEVITFLKRDADKRPVILLDWSCPEKSSGNKEWRDFLVELEEKVASKVAELPEDKRVLAEKITPHRSCGIEGRFVCPACIFFALKDLGREGERLGDRIHW